MNDHLQEKVQHDQANVIHHSMHSLLVYLGRCWSVLTEGAVLLTVTIAGYTVFLYVCKILWNLYMSTHTGEMFAAYFPEEANSTYRLLQMNLLMLSIWITVYSFVISLTVGSICRLLYFARYIFDRFGTMGRTVFCGLPLAALVAFYVQPLYEFPAWDTTFAVVLIPTLSVCNRAFIYAAKLLPELGDLKKIAGH